MSDRRYIHKERGALDRRKDFQQRVLFLWLSAEMFFH